MPVAQHSANESMPNSASIFPKLEKKASPVKQPQAFAHPPTFGTFSTAKAPAVHQPAPRRTLSQRDIQQINKIMEDIDKEDTSDVEAPGFEGELDRYHYKGKKRALDTDRAEGVRCKVCYLGII